MCEQCGKQTSDTLVNIFSEELCEDCWDNYLMTERGKLEYFVGLAKEELPLEDYDADFILHCSEMWKKHKNLLNWSLQDIERVEAFAKELGIL